MKCFRCNKYDFDFKQAFQGAVYVECYHCQQGYTIQSKLNLIGTELLGDVSGDFIQLWCRDCKSSRFIDSNNTHLVYHFQFCNRCVEEARKLKEAGEISYTQPIGEKLSWNDFLKLNRPDK